MNIGLISLGSSGTMGYFSLIKNILRNFSNNEHDFYVISEYNYKDYAKFENKNIHFVTIPKQRMTFSIAGKITYRYKSEILKILKSRNITNVFYSTFFDEDLLKETNALGIRSFLISYPLRDTHERILFGKKYLNLFEKYILLKDIYGQNKYEDNKIIIAKIATKNKNMDLRKKNKVLVTVGGGGRPSSLKFLKLIISAIERINDVKFVFLLGAYNKKSFPTRSNMVIKKWSYDIEQEYDDADFVISEAGFFTVNELLHRQKPAILIPGHRTIDNQELRAVEWEFGGCGSVILREPQKEEIPKKIREMINSDFRTLQNNFVAKIHEYDKYPLIDDVIMELIK